jgi:hypothetical protein
MPTKNTLRILVALQIAALLGAAVVATVSIRSLVGYYGLPSYIVSSAPAVFWLRTLLSLALLVAAVGLCFFADVFRTLYVALTIAVLLLRSLRPSVSSGPMDLLQQTDAVLRGVIMAVVYFSPLSDLYKTRDRGDVHSAQRLLRYLILAQIPLLLAGFGAGFLSGLHNRELAAISDALDALHPASGVLVGISMLAYVIVNVCLYKFWRGARTAYLIVTVVMILETLYLDPSVTSAGVEIFATGITVLNGVILGLAYFTPLRAVFDRDVGTQAPPAPPVTSPHVGSPVMAGPVGSPMAAAVAPSITAAVAPSAGVSVEPLPPPAVADASSVTRPASVEHLAFCGACGARSQGGKFCIQCGAPLPNKVLCPKCGIESEPGRKFCRECGTPLSG